MPTSPLPQILQSDLPISTTDLLNLVSYDLPSGTVFQSDPAQLPDSRVQSAIQKGIDIVMSYLSGSRYDDTTIMTTHWSGALLTYACDIVVWLLWKEAEASDPLEIRLIAYRDALAFFSNVRKGLQELAIPLVPNLAGPISSTTVSGNRNFTMGQPGVPGSCGSLDDMFMGGRS